MANAPAKGKIVPVIVDADQTVEIHWRYASGLVQIEQRTCPRIVLVPGNK